MNFTSSSGKYICENQKNTKKKKIKVGEFALIQYENICKAAIIITAWEMSKGIEKQINAQFDSTEICLNTHGNFKIIKCVTSSH